MVYCPNCRLELIKGRYEYYCNQCGYVMENEIFNFVKIKDKQKAYYAWRCNFKQTLNQEVIKNGRISIRGTTIPWVKTR